VPKKTKIPAIAFLWISLSCSAILVVRTLWLHLLLLAIGTVVTIHIVKLKTLTKEIMEEVK